MPLPGQPPPEQTQKKVDYQGESVKELITHCIEDARGNTARLDRDQQDILNHLMYRGGPENQWVVWDPNTNSYIQRPYDGEAGLPEWAPRCVTNKFANKIDGNISIQVQSRPTLEFQPVTDDDEDLATADVCQDALPALLEEIGYEKGMRAEICSHRALMDKVAVIYYFDNDPKHGMDQIQALQCLNPECGTLTMPDQVQESGETCPECGTDFGMTEAYDQNMDPIGVQYPKGKICAKVVPSLEFSLPSGCRHPRAEEAAWVLIHSREPKEDVLREWPKFKEILEKAIDDGKMGVQRQYADQLHRLSSPRSAAQRAYGGGNKKTLGPVVYRLQHDPIEDERFYFPQGLYAVMIGETVVDAGPLPYPDDRGQPCKSVLITTFRESGTSAFGKPPADDLVPIQVMRNMVESLILLILMHDASPRTWIPLSVTLEDEPSGAPGFIGRYRSLIPGDKPVTEQGHNPPEGLYKFLEIIDSSMDEISLLNSVLQGERPAGDPTLGEVQVLQEQGQAQFRVPLDNLVAFEKEQATLLLRIARRSMWSPRFRQIRGDDGEWSIKQFAAADLSGHVNVTCDPSTAWPKSPLMEQLRVGKAVEMGILQPAMDPELSAKLLERNGLSDLKPSLDVDRKQIARQIDGWKAAQMPEQILPINPIIDNLQLHFHFKQQFLKTEEAEELAQANQPVYAAMVAHVMQIQQMLQQQMMQAAAAQQGPPPPDDRSPVEKGDTSKLDEAVGSGQLEPVQAQAPGQGLEQAVQSGQLVPSGAMQPPAAPLPSIDDLIRAKALVPVLGPQNGEGQEQQPMPPMGAM